MSGGKDQHEGVGQGAGTSTTIVLAALSVVLLTTSLSTTAWWIAGRPVSEWPAWMEAGATLAAVGAAIVAGFYAARAFRLEFQRERRWEETQRSAQASLVAAWPGGSGMSTENHQAYYNSLSATIRNASELPVTDVQLNFYMITDSRQEDDGALIAGYKTDYIPPSTAVPINITPLKPSEGGVVIAHEKRPKVMVELTFRDTSSVEWIRTVRNELYPMHH